MVQVMRQERRKEIDYIDTTPYFGTVKGTKGSSQC